MSTNSAAKARQFSNSVNNNSTTEVSSKNPSNFSGSNWKDDLKAGLMVSLIALPLCLGIAMASGFPAFGGVITAIVGGLLIGPISGSQLTIKGPAAGLIAIAVASVETFGAGDAQLGYRCTLAVIFVASVLQVIFALLKLGRFGDIFPVSAVHGMLAAIGL
jgi:MFS superfamily sulfate permease-like transporter